MQPDRFTTKVQEAFATAQRLATQHRNTEVAPAHLLVALLQSEDVLDRYAEDARDAGEDEIVALFVSLRQHHREVAQGLREVLKRNLTPQE